MSLLLNSRSHHLTFGVGCVLVSVVMLLFLLHKTHEQLEIKKEDLAQVNDKFMSLTRQFEWMMLNVSIAALYEYKERLENSFVDLKEKKSSMTSQSDSLKSELSVLKQSHRTEMQRLQEDLDSCRRREEMAVIHNQPQRDEALPPQEARAGDTPNTGKMFGGDHDVKVINSLSKSSSHHPSGGNRQPSAGNVINFIHNDEKEGVAAAETNPTPQPGMQPSVDPNQDPVGNVFI